MCSLKCKDISKHGQRRNLFFPQNCTWVWSDSFYSQVPKKRGWGQKNFQNLINEGGEGRNKWGGRKLKNDLKCL